MSQTDLITQLFTVLDANHRELAAQVKALQERPGLAWADQQAELAAQRQKNTGAAEAYHEAGVSVGRWRRRFDTALAAGIGAGFTLLARHFGGG